MSVKRKVTVPPGSSKELGVRVSSTGSWPHRTPEYARFGSCGATALDTLARQWPDVAVVAEDVTRL
jgi:hypothetical protein